MKVLVIIPCYNEETCIQDVVRSINSIKNGLGFTLDVAVVNDCSRDNSVNIIKKLDCILLDLPVNLGIGGAMHCGYKYAFRNDYDITIQVDGDGQHPATEIVNVISGIIKNGWDVSIGSRFINKEGFQSSFMRRLGIKYFQWLNQSLVGISITDSTSGFRAFNRKAIALAYKYYPDEYPEPESIVYFKLNGLSIGEIPVLMEQRKGGTSSIGTLKSVYYMIKVTLAIIFVYFKHRK